MDEPSTIPQSFRAGDTLTWLRTLRDYPADAGWALSYRLIGATQTIDVSASAEGVSHRVNVPAATTAAWPSGEYVWMELVTRGADRHTLGSGVLRVDPDPAAINAGDDLRSHARRVLDAIEAVIEGRASEADESFEIDGVALRYRPIADLLALRDRYRQEVRAERAAEQVAAGLLSGRKRVLVRF